MMQVACKDCGKYGIDCVCKPKRSFIRYILDNPQLFMAVCLALSTPLWVYLFVRDGFKPGTAYVIMMLSISFFYVIVTYKKYDAAKAKELDDINNWWNNLTLEQKKGLMKR